jgi:hypothetical protein
MLDDLANRYDRQQLAAITATLDLIRNREAPRCPRA